MPKDAADGKEFMLVAYEQPLNDCVDSSDEWDC
jgi:hypothetical protein